MIGRTITLFFIIAAAGIGFFVCMIFNGSGGHNENTNANDNVNDLITQLNQTSDDRNIIIVVNNLDKTSDLVPFEGSYLSKKP